MRARAKGVAVRATCARARMRLYLSIFDRVVESEDLIISEFLNLLLIIDPMSNIITSLTLFMRYFYTYISYVTVISYNI